MQDTLSFSVKYGMMLGQAEEVDGTMLVVWLVVFALVVVGFWKVFQKAGHPGWTAIIPIYNLYILTQVAGRPWWWLILYFIPLASLIPGILIPVDIAKAFGKGIGFALGLFFLPFIFYPILGFGSAQYQGPPAR
jgi:hypothetical protein